MSRYVRAVAVALAGAVAVLAGLLVIGAVDGAAARQHRLSARSPVMVDGGASAIARYGETADVLDGRQYPVIGLVPLAAGSPPPGLSRWPEPGEAWLSPALLAADRHGDLSTRYGRFAGVIERAGLADSTEFFVYYRPAGTAATPDGAWTSVGGWGRPHPRPSGASGLSDHAPTLLAVLVAGVVGVPVVALAAVGGNKRSRRRPPDRMPRRFARSLGAALPSAAAGAAAAGTLVWWSVHRSVRLPVTGYNLADAPVRAEHLFPLVVGMAVGVALLAAASGAAGDEDGAGQARAAVARLAAGVWPGRLATTGFTLLLLAALDVPGGPALLITGCVATMLALPLVTLRGTATVGRWLSAAAKRRRSAARAAAGRWLRTRPGSVVVFSVAAGLALMVPATATAVATGTGPEERRALDLQATVAEQIVQVSSAGMLAGQDRFADAVGVDRVLRVYTVDRSTVLVGTCVALARLGSGAGCPTVPTATDGLFAEWSGFGQALVTLGIIASGDRGATVSSVGEPGRPRAVLVLNGDGRVGHQSIARTAFAMLPLPYVSFPGREWLGAVRHAEDVAAWVRLVAVFGIAVTATAGVAGIAVGFTARQRTTGRAVTLATCGWALIPPTLICCALATAAAHGSAFAVRGMRGSGDVPVTVLTSALPLAVVAATAACLLCALGRSPAPGGGAALVEGMTAARGPRDRTTAAARRG